MRYVLDIAIVLVVILFASNGARKGFIKSCVDFIGGFAAMIGAGILSLPVAKWVYYTFFHDALLEKISSAVTGMEVKDAVHMVFAEFPDVIVRGLKSFGITEADIAGRVEGGTMSIAEGIADQMSPLLIGFVRIFAMLVLFILLLVVLRALATLLTGVCHLPILHSVNQLLGTVFGVLMSVVALWVALACVQALVPLFSGEWQQRITELTSNSVICKLFYEFNPAYSLIK